MRKSELIDVVGEKLGNKKVAAVAIDAFVDTITAAVANGEKVTLIGFGSWEPVTRPERQSRNPATGARITVPATRVPKFRAGAALKAAVAKARRPAA
jgi:DNA-binding protein HU-beta